MKNFSREFQIFAKPVGSYCNLNCSYCYYLDKKNLYPDSDHFHMPPDVLEEYIIQHINATTETIISFSWHGGEPLLAGIEFYRKALKFQAANRPAGKKIINGIQTNGTLLNEEWCRFFAENHFVIGVSIDGPAEFHNIHRNMKDETATWDKVMGGIKLLGKFKINTEVLCVVNSDNVKHPIVIYSFLRELGVKYITFLPLVEADNNFSGGVSKSSVPPEEFGQFLSRIFDDWVENDIGNIKIQIFEEAARTAFNQEHTLCIFKVNCGGVPVIEHNGDFYSCDHYVDRTHFLGNINDNSLSWYLDSKGQNAFGMVKSLTLPEYCLSCEVRSMCNGECPKNRFILTPSGEPGLNYLCQGYKYFFNHCKPFVEAIAEAWKDQKS